MIFVSRPISEVECSWDSSGRSVIVPEIQINDEEKVISDINMKLGEEDIT